MPGPFSAACARAAFTAISLLLLFAPSAEAKEKFESGLREGMSHGKEMLSRHGTILRPSAVPDGAVPAYADGKRKDMESRGAAWSKNPEGMRTEAEAAVREGDPATSDAPGFLKRSSESRPEFTIDPETDPVIASSRRAVEKPSPDCEKKEACAEYATESWKERESCYDEATRRTVACNVRKTVTETARTRTFGYLTLEIDRNDASVGFSAVLDTDGDGAADATLRSPSCLNRRRGSTWGLYKGFSLGGPIWRGCYELAASGRFVPLPSSVCVSVFGLTANRGALPLEDGPQNAALERTLVSALSARFPPPSGRVAGTGTSGGHWTSARRCREGDGDGNGWRVSYSATRTDYSTKITTDDGCRGRAADRSCGLLTSRCLETTVTRGGETVCENRRKTYRCVGPRAEGRGCAELRADGCHQTGAECVLWSNEHPERPDPPGANLGTCLVHENFYECPRSARLCRKKTSVLDCGGEIRCATGADCFDTETSTSGDFPKTAARMAMLSDMERCMATARDGELSPGGYGPLAVDGAAGETAAPIDCSDDAAGGVSVFKGRRYRCDLNLAGFVQNCCKRKGLFRGYCPQGTRELRARRDGARACRYVGMYKKKVLGITIRKRKVYCCFNSKMARLVHEQGRPQLLGGGLWRTAAGGGWGTAKNPDCGGMTAEQLQKIDFDAVDFSEVYGDIFGEADRPKLLDLRKTAERRREELCAENPEAKAELCGGEDGKEDSR